MERKSNAKYNVIIDSGLLLSYDSNKQVTLVRNSNGAFKYSKNCSKCDEYRNDKKTLFPFLTKNICSNEHSDVSESDNEEPSVEEHEKDSPEQLYISGFDNEQEDSFSITKVLPLENLHLCDSDNEQSVSSLITKKLTSDKKQEESSLINKKFPGKRPDVHLDISGLYSGQASTNGGIADLLDGLYILSDSDNEKEDSSDESKSDKKDSNLIEKGPVFRKQLNSYTPYEKKDQNRDNFNPENLYLSADLYCNGSCGSNTCGIEKFFTTTSQELETSRTENRNNDNFDHFCVTPSHSSANIQDGEEISLVSQDSSSNLYPEDSGTSLISSSKAERIDVPPEPLSSSPDSNSDLNDYAKYINDQAFKALLNELGMGNERKNKIRRNKASKVKVSTAKMPIASKPMKNKARESFAAFLCDDKVHDIQRKIYMDIIRQLTEESKAKEDVKVIYIEKEGNNASEKRTNLHNAVRNCELEEIFCLIEIHMNYSKQSLTELNLADKSGKTAIDYAVQNRLTPVVEYLQGYNCRPSDEVVPRHLN